MPPSHEAALRAIEACRSAALGGRVYRCDACQSSLARDERFLGGAIGMLGVLQTWTRDLR